MEGASGNQLWERICTRTVDVLGENPSTRSGARRVFSWESLETEGRLIDPALLVSWDLDAPLPTLIFSYDLGPNSLKA